MILNLNKIKSRLAILHNIPKYFFKRIESATAFGEDLFPSWSNTVYVNTMLKVKFENVYNIYKSLQSKSDRDMIIEAFENTNKVELLCQNDRYVRMLTINDLPESIRDSIDRLFEYLYNTATKYPHFIQYTNSSLNQVVDRFISNHKIEVCPFCGLEAFINVDGQSRLAMDHWLCRDLFPFAAVNFNNLIPVGDKCNGRPAKGSLNVLESRDHVGERAVAYYPYATHHGVTGKFLFIKEPNIGNTEDGDWSFTFSPNDMTELPIFNSWDKTLNISTRYIDYVKKNVLNMWETDYKAFIEDSTFTHAQTLAEFKVNLQNWMGAFPIARRVGSIAYRSFINYLLNEASESYLTGLYKMFYSEYHYSLLNQP